ncbi:hypothetical protein Tco_1181241 [Tanacetum coccineum]
MPSSPSSPHRHHHILVIIPTPLLLSSPPRTITSTHAKHHRDNLLEGQPQKEVFGLGGSRHRGVGLAARQSGTTGGGMSGWDSGLWVRLVG